jgi:hypothetical protein
MRKLDRLAGDFQKKLLGEAYVHGINPADTDAYKRAEVYAGVISRINLVFRKNYQSWELLKEGDLSSKEFLSHLHFPVKKD